MSNDTITAITTIVDGLSEFNQERTIGALCWTSKNQMKFTRDKINEVVSQLKDLQEHFLFVGQFAHKNTIKNAPPAKVPGRGKQPT